MSITFFSGYAFFILKVHEINFQANGGWTTFLLTTTTSILFHARNYVALIKIMKLTCIQKWKHINEYKNWQQFSDTACSRPFEELSAVDKVTSLWLFLFARRHVELVMFWRSVIMLSAFGVDGMMQIFTSASVTVVIILVTFFVVWRIIVGALLLEVFTFFERASMSVCHATSINDGLLVKFPSVLWWFTTLFCSENFPSFLQTSAWWSDEWLWTTFWCTIFCFSSSLILERNVVRLRFTRS